MGRRGQGQDRRLAGRQAPTWSSASRAGITPGTRWWSATRSTNCRCCRRESSRGTPSIIGNGVVLDPWALRDEVAKLRGQGVDDHSRAAAHRRDLPADPAHPPRSRRACARMPRGAGKIGTTRRGIGPAYEDKVGRRAIRVCDLAHLDELDPLLDRLCAHHDALRAGFRQAAGRPRAVAERPCRNRRLRSAVRPPGVARPRRGRRGAGGASCSKARRACCSTSIMAPIRSSPRRTPSPARPARAAASGPSAAGFVLGIVKAYTTRVGSGPFPTELDDDTGQRLGERGHEFGTVTGRKRRCGWFDAVLVRQSAAVSGITGIALTKIDVLDGFEKVKICTGYRIGEKVYDYLPPHAADQARVVASLRGDSTAGQDHRGRAQLGRSARAGDQICPPHRGTDPLPGRAGRRPAPSATTRSWCAIRLRAERLFPSPRMKLGSRKIPPGDIMTKRGLFLSTVIAACRRPRGGAGDHRPARRARAGRSSHQLRSKRRGSPTRASPRRRRLHADDDRPSPAGGRRWPRWRRRGPTTRSC